MTTAEPVVYKITDGDDDCFENFVVFAPEVSKWVVKCDLHPGFRALLEKGGDWRPIEDSADEMVLFDNAEEAIAAAVRKHDEERERL